MYPVTEYKIISVYDALLDPACQHRHIYQPNNHITLALVNMCNRKLKTDSMNASWICSCSEVSYRYSLWYQYTIWSTYDHLHILPWRSISHFLVKDIHPHHDLWSLNNICSQETTGVVFSLHMLQLHLRMHYSCKLRVGENLHCGFPFLFSHTYRASWYYQIFFIRQLMHKWIVLKTILKFTLKLTLKQLRHVSADRKSVV